MSLVGQPGFAVNQAFKVFSDFRLNFTVWSIEFKQTVKQIKWFSTFSHMIHQPFIAFRFHPRKPILQSKPAKLGLDQIPERGTKQRFLKDGSESVSLVGSAIHHNLFVGRAGKKEGINYKLEIKIILPLNECSDGKHIPGGKRFRPAVKVLDDARGATKADGVEPPNFQNSKIITLVYAVPFRVCHNLIAGTPGGEFQVYRCSRKTKHLPQAVRQISAI